MNTQSLESDSTIPAFFERAAPVTESQREIWLACQMGDDASLAYNEAVAIDLVGALDVSALERAVLAVVQRHDSLRSVFAADGSEIQVFPEPAAGAFRQSDGTNDTGLAESIQRTAVTTPFDLEGGPLFYAHLVRVAAGRHRLFLVAHHIVCDGWSTGRIVAEIAGHYSAYVAGVAIRAGEADAFCDYADHLLSADSVARGQDALSFWLKQYEHDVPVLELPADVRRARNRGFQSERLDLVIDGQTLGLLEEVCRREAASVFAGVVTAFTAWLGRISGADDIAVAVPRAGQLDDGRPSLVGHCVRTLPLRLAAEQGATFADLLARNQEAIIEAFDHSALTYGSLLRSLALPRDPARLPLVNVMFNLDQELSAESMEFHGLTAEVSTVPRVAENFEIFVNAVRFAGGLRVECQYAAWLFSPAHAGALLASFVEFIGELVRHADRPIGALSIVPRGVFATLSGWQPRPVATPSPGNLADYVLRHAARLGGKRSVISGGEMLSYDDLAYLSAAIAQRLLAAGLRPGDYVGVALDRSPRMVAAMLGVLRAGGAYLPLDPGYPTERLQFMIEDAGLQLLICDPDGAARVAMPELRVLSLGSADADALLTEKVAAVSMRVAPESPAYVIYTSGSTGRPKGVAVPHESVRNFLESMAQSPGLGEADVLVAVTTLSFDISVLELFLPLSVGGTVAIASRDQAMDGVALAQLLGNCAATAMQATPEMWRLLLRSGWRGSRSFKVLCGGEALPPDLATELLPCCGELWNLYGPTETTVWSTCELVRDPQAITVGRPIQNTTVWMLNAQGQLCPPGVAGEICIGGRGVALGYLKRPELTAEKFIDSPPSIPGGRRLYRTGDRGRWRLDGRIEHLGRIDNQVKLRGYRIELGEVEAALSRHPQVRQALATVREVSPGDSRLVGYVIPEALDQAPDHVELRAHLRAILPDHMVPQHFVVLETIPTLPNGKVNRKALPAPDKALVQRRAATVVRPSNEAERLVLDAFEASLALADIGLDDDFFVLGGHSLLAARLASSLSASLQTPVPLRVIFDEPTPRRLAQAILSRREHSREALRPALRRRENRSVAPVSIMQERVLVMEELNAGRPTYNTPSAHRLRGSLDPNAFQRALDLVVERQPVLRTRFSTSAGRPIQVIDDAARLDVLPIVDLSDIPSDEREPELMRRLQEAADTPFDVTGDRLVRASLYRLSVDDHVLFLMPHHLIWDGWSFDIFYANFAAAYSASLAGIAGPLPTLTHDYGDFAAWQASWMQTEGFQVELAAVRDRLRTGFDPKPLPTDRPRSQGMSGKGATEWISVEPATVESIGRFSRRHGVTHFMTLLGVYSVVLARFTGHTDVVVGSPVRGRSSAELEAVMGFFTNLLPIPLRLAPDESFAQLLGSLRTHVLSAYAHPDVPFESVAAELRNATGAASVLYNGLFSYQDIRDRQTRWGNLEHAPVPLFQSAATEDIGLWFSEGRTGMIGGVTYNTELFDVHTAVRFKEAYLETLARVLARPEIPLRDLLSASEAEIRQIESWCNPSDDEVPTRLREALALVESDRLLDLVHDDPCFDPFARAAALVGGTSRLEGAPPATPESSSLDVDSATVLVVNSPLRSLGVPIQKLQGKRLILVASSPHAPDLAALRSSGAQVHIAITEPQGGRIVFISDPVPARGSLVTGRAMPGVPLRFRLDHAECAPIGAFGFTCLGAGAQSPHAESFTVAPQGRWRADGKLELRLALDLQDEEAQGARHMVTDNRTAVAPTTDAPLTAMGSQLAEVWREVLGVRDVIAGDNFFDLGGNSLQVMQVLDAMHARTKRRIAARKFLFDSLESLAAAYDSAEIEAPQGGGLLRKLGGLFGRGQK